VVGCRRTERGPGYVLDTVQRLTALLYRRVASGTKTARSRSDQRSDTGTAWRSGQAVGGGMAALVLPKRSREAWTRVETGFHSAIGVSGAGSRAGSTNALDRKTSGNVMIVATLLKDSGVRRESATAAVTQEKAYANSSSMTNPRAASHGGVWMRQPTSSPTSVMVTMLVTFMMTSATVWPVSTAEGDIGRVRKRSKMPFCRSWVRV